NRVVKFNATSAGLSMRDCPAAPIAIDMRWFRWEGHQSSAVATVGTANINTQISMGLIIFFLLGRNSSMRRMCGYVLTGKCSTRIKKPIHGKFGAKKNQKFNVFRHRKEKGQDFCTNLEADLQPPFIFNKADKSNGLKKFSRGNRF
ncbi:MAG: hypothetical protein ACU841_11855, partial [Gammaproteobacteria bacterium]